VRILVSKALLLSLSCCRVTNLRDRSIILQHVVHSVACCVTTGHAGLAGSHFL